MTTLKICSCISWGFAIGHALFGSIDTGLLYLILGWILKIECNTGGKR